MIEDLKKKFPVLMRVLEKSPAMADLRNAAGFVESSADPLQAIHDAKQNEVRAKTLITQLVSTYLGDRTFALEIPDIEADLARIASAFEPDAAIRKLKSAYLDKLLNDGQYEDVKYELASTAIFCDVLDGGKVSLEECLPGSKKNPDITGTLSGVRMRVEVTVDHDEWPPYFCEKAQEIAESANVSGGYTADLNIPLVREADGDLVKTLIETLDAARRSQPGQPVVIDGFTYAPTGDEFRAMDLSNPRRREEDVKAPLRRIEFTDNRMLKHVNSSALTRATMTKDESEAMGQRFPKPDGVIVSADLPTNPQAHKSSTVGEKVHKALETKLLGQCEVGSINIIVLGEPMPMNDSGVHAALIGAGAAVIPYGPGAEVLPAEFVRSAMGPFTPLAAVNASSLPDDQKQYITHEIQKFARVSAVLVLRLKTGHAKAELILNPNAERPISTKDAKRIRKVADRRLERIGKGSTKRHLSTLLWILGVGLVGAFLLRRVLKLGS